MKKAAISPKKAQVADPTGRAKNYQVSRALPDLRNQKLAPKPLSKATKTRRFNKKKIVKRTLLVLLAVFIIVGGWLGYKVILNSNRLGTNIWSIFDNSKLRGEDRGRINILLAGDSSDDPGHAGAELTDSIMLISINPNNKTAFAMSIPRDLYVNIPGNDYSKINAANVYGNADGFKEAGYPDGGMGLLEKTVSQTLGIPIDYYALINYTAFKDTVNAVGGVTVTIDSGYKNGVYDPFANLKLPNGTMQINGDQALALSRARGEGPGAFGVGSDFDRTQYQRDILLALKDKATSTGVLTNPVKISSLFDAVGNNVKTDLSLGNIRRLNNLTKDINNADVKSVSLNDVDGKNLLISYTTRNGQSALVPAAGIDDFSQIKELLNQLFNSVPTAPKTN
ncbi:MAG: LCP family protein [Candidatus Saccharimonadales bacterium]